MLLLWCIRPTSEPEDLAGVFFGCNMCSLRYSVPVPVEKFNVDLYGLIDESGLKKNSLGLLNLATEQQQAS